MGESRIACRRWTLDERLLLRVMARLVRIHDQFGNDVYRDAARGALVAMGRSAMRAAEGNVDTGNVVMFPPDPGSFDGDDNGDVA